MRAFLILKTQQPPANPEGIVTAAAYNNYGLI